MTTNVRFVRLSAVRPRWLRLGAGAVAGVAAFALVGTSPAFAAPAAARPAHGVTVKKTLETQDLQSFLSKATSTTGVKLYVSFSAARVIGFSQLDSAQVILARTNDSEEHLWGFPIGKTAFVTKSSGAGSLKTSAAFGSYGSVTLTFKPTASKRIDVCNASNYTLQQTERVSGKLLFDTQSTGPHAWGKVGSATRSFTFNGQTDLFSIYTGGSCTPKPVVGTCYNEVSWSAGTQSGTTSIGFSGSTGDGPSGISASRYVTLSTPVGANRIDFVFGAAPRPVLSTSGKAATEKVTTSGSAFQGSATIKGPKGQVTKSKCKTGTLVDTTWSKGTTFRPGASTLSAREQIFGTITLPAGKVMASIDRVKS